MAAGEATVRDLISNVHLLTSLLRVHKIRVERLNEGMADITVTFSNPNPNLRSSPTPVTYANRSPHLQSSATISVNVDLEQLPIYLDESHRASIVLNKSILIGGESGSGKSNLVWHLLDTLNQHTPIIHYRLHVIDPAGGVELNDLQGALVTHQYVDRGKKANEVIRAFHKSMEERLSLMKQRGVKRHFPTKDEPLEICIIDELLLVKAALQADDVSSPMGETLAVGRKALHIVIGCSQLGQKDAVGAIRDLFPQRICLRTRTREATDTVLGSGATSAGAACHMITAPGEGYVYTDTSEGYENVKAPFIPPHRTKQIASYPDRYFNTIPLPSSPTGTLYLPTPPEGTL